MIKNAKAIHTKLKKMITYPSKESEDLLRKWGKSIVEEAAKVQHETPVGFQYESIIAIKEQL